MIKAAVCNSGFFFHKVIMGAHIVISEEDVQ